MSDIARNDEWNSDRPQEERKYDGPAGMDPDGVIDSNWDEVNIKKGICEKIKSQTPPVGLRELR